MNISDPQSRKEIDALANEIKAVSLLSSLQ